jgi:hypothetical protein
VNGPNGRQITIERGTGPGTNAATFNIGATTATDRIDFIRVVTTTSQTQLLKLQIGTVDSPFPILSVGSISVDGNAAVRVESLAVQEDVGQIMDVQDVFGMEVEGNVTGDIRVIRNTQNGGGGRILTSSIYGDVLGNITVGDYVSDLTVRGSFGNAGGAARTMRVFGNIWKLTIGEVLDNATILAQGPSGEARGISILEIDDQWGAGCHGRLARQ